MSDELVIFSLCWLLTQISSVLMLLVGVRYSNHSYLLKIAKIAHRKKLESLDRIWPLTKIRPAVARKDTIACSIIFSSLIIFKSVASLVFGILMVFWLPMASLVVPSIIAIHDPDDVSLLPWIKKVSFLQVTSHSLAAALGFVLIIAGPLSDEPLKMIILANLKLVVLVCIASLGFAVAAGRIEALGVIQRGI
jgi:hypothetical protein